MWTIWDCGYICIISGFRLSHLTAAFIRDQKWSYNAVIFHLPFKIRYLFLMVVCTMENVVVFFNLNWSLFCLLTWQCVCRCYEHLIFIHITPSQTEKWIITSEILRLIGIQFLFICCLHYFRRWYVLIETLPSLGYFILEKLCAWTPFNTWTLGFFCYFFF